MFKDCMEGKRSPPTFTLGPSTLQRPHASPRDAHAQPSRPERSRSGGDRSGSGGDRSGRGSGGDSSGGDGSSSGAIRELVAALHRGGMQYESLGAAVPRGASPSAQPSEGLLRSYGGRVPSAAALFASGDNLLMRPGAASRASCTSSSGSEPVPGGNSGRFSRRSGVAAHTRALSAAKLSSSTSVQGRASSLSLKRAGMHSALSGAYSAAGSIIGSLSCASLDQLAFQRSASHGSLHSPDVARETPPGVSGAFESHRSLIACPAPRRASILAQPTSKPTRAWRLQEEEL